LFKNLERLLLMGFDIFEPNEMLAFGKTEPREGGGICREEEAIFCRADSGGDEAGRYARYAFGN
jgi:hypothetical protein